MTIRTHDYTKESETCLSVVYRFEDCSDSYGPFIQELILPVTKITDKGYWIGPEYMKKWVSSSGKKRYAFPNRHDALVSYIHRKQRHEKILLAQLKYVAMNLQTAKAFVRDFASNTSSPIEKLPWSLDIVKI